MPGKMFMLAVVVSMIAGCAPLQPSGCHKTSAIGSYSSGRWEDQDEWGKQARRSGQQQKLLCAGKIGSRKSEAPGV